MVASRPGTLGGWCRGSGTRRLVQMGVAAKGLGAPFQRLQTPGRSFELAVLRRREKGECREIKGTLLSFPKQVHG